MMLLCVVKTVVVWGKNSKVQSVDVTLVQNIFSFEPACIVNKFLRTGSYFYGNWCCRCYKVKA